MTANQRALTSPTFEVGEFSPSPSPSSLLPSQHKTAPVSPLARFLGCFPASQVLGWSPLVPHAPSLVPHAPSLGAAEKMGAEARALPAGRQRSVLEALPRQI